MQMKNLLYFIITALILFSCSKKQGQENNPKNGINLIDTKGNSVHLDKPAEKIVCLFDPSLDIIYMLQEQDRLIGIPADIYFDKEQFDYLKHIDERIANKSLPTPGSNDLVNIESIIALKPDLVIVQHMTENMIATLKSMNIPVYVATADTYDNLVQEMNDIALMTDSQERGKQIVDYSLDLIDKMKKDNLSDDQKKSVYFTWANGKIFSTAGRVSMMNNCLELGGTKNVCPSDIDKPNINPETLISWNPDMIVMWNDDPNLFYEKKELESINAIKNKQIYNLMPMFFYNPHTFKSICASKAIETWAYGTDQQKNNTKEEIKDIIVELYGVENGKKLTDLYDSYKVD